MHFVELIWALREANRHVVRRRSVGRSVGRRNDDRR
jgi:hypothetical protein